MSEPLVASAATADAAEPGTPIAQMRDLHVSLSRGGVRSPILRGVDLEIAKREVLGVVGESGSGKSVLSLALMGLLPTESSPRVQGEIRVVGTDMTNATQAAERRVRREHLGVIFQDPMTSLNPTMRVGRQITEVSHDLGEALRLLAAVGVPEPDKRVRAFPHELSGGLRQRVMAAIALTGHPALVIADEPTTALDVTVQARFLQLLGDLRSEFGCSVLFITHDLSVAAQVTDRIAVFYQGRVAELGPTREVLAHPSHPYTVGLLASRLALDTPRVSTLKTLPPETRDLGERLLGCAYHTRCPLAVERCAIEQPPLAAHPRDPTGHLRACWREVEDVTATVVPAAGLHMLGERDAPVPLAAPAPLDTAVAVQCTGLTCTFTTKSGRGPKHVVNALRGVDLTVRAGEALSIVGESGSGKSTLLRIIAGLQHATGGTVAVSGTSQMVFQDAWSSLTPWLSIRTMLRERLRPLRLSKAESASQIERILDVVGLTIDVLAARPAELSGGQRQRVALARAVIVPPAILLCDEPTSSLDASMAASVLNLIRQTREEFGMAVLFVTHDLAVARLMGDRIAVLFEGKIVEIGDCDQILTAPSAEHTRTLLDAVPRIETAVPVG